MHDGDELCLESDLHITDNVFDGGSNGIPGSEQGVHNYAEVFNLEICKPCTRL